MTTMMMTNEQDKRFDNRIFNSSVTDWHLLKSRLNIVKQRLQTWDTKTPIQCQDLYKGKCKIKKTGSNWCAILGLKKKFDEAEVRWRIQENWWGVRTGERTSENWWWLVRTCENCQELVKIMRIIKNWWEQMGTESTDANCIHSWEAIYWELTTKSRELEQGRNHGSNVGGRNRRKVEGSGEGARSENIKKTFQTNTSSVHKPPPPSAWLRPWIGGNCWGRVETGKNSWELITINNKW